MGSWLDVDAGWIPGRIGPKSDGEGHGIEFQPPPPRADCRQRGGDVRLEQSGVRDGREREPPGSKVMWEGLLCYPQ